MDEQSQIVQIDRLYYLLISLFLEEEIVERILAGLKGETNEQWKDLLAFMPVCQERLRAPAALYHDNPGVDSEQQKVCHTTNSKTTTLN